VGDLLPIRQGAIYWIDDCPPLDGETAKRRPVIVLSPKSELQMGGAVAVVACSASVTEGQNPDRIPLPNLQDNPRAKTGLPRPCWAVPRWLLAVDDRSRLVDKAGYVSGPLLTRIIEAVLAAGQK
jgi:mRNA-degrading endonuclease toxin of MazEF toxin-antitoxin module